LEKVTTLKELQKLKRSEAALCERSQAIRRSQTAATVSFSQKAQQKASIHQPIQARRLLECLGRCV
jgi:hypothetical protein